jgi:hypothetical protein
VSPQTRCLCHSACRAISEIRGSKSWRNPEFLKALSPCAESRLGLGENVKVTRALDNDEIRMTNDEPITKRGPRITRIDAKKITPERIIRVNSRHSRANLFFSYSCQFACRAVAARRRVIFCGLILMLAVQICASLAQAQSMNMIGRWNVEIMFGSTDHRSLRFEAQDAGKGSFLLLDPRLKVWGPAKPSEAKWNQGEGNSVTFSGPVEFMLGNVGRDAGTLVFQGKFETADSITGEVEFSPLVGDRPSKHGTFKAVRAQ